MLTHKEKERYSSGWIRRQREKEAKIKQKHELALKKAKEVAQLLKRKYGIKKVVLFGSTVSGKFWEKSDIDIAVYGMDEGQYLDLTWQAYQISFPFKVDLIPIEQASGKLIKKIEQEGVEI